MTTIQSRWASLAAIFVVLVWLAAPVRTAQADVALLLAQARDAMGGDAALKAITSITVTGSHMEDIGPKKLETAVEYFYELPDKSARRGSRSFENGPGTTSRMTLREGFNGDGLIAEQNTPNMGVNPTLEINDGRMQQSAEARLRGQVMSEKRDFARLMLPLFAESLAALPLKFTYIGTDAVATTSGGAPTNVHVIEAKDATQIALREDRHLLAA